ncbi:MAG: hypothetical protein ABFC84_04075 [Veillonellales bacterium]
MAMELKEKNFKVIVLKNVQVQEKNGQYEINAETLNGKIMNISINEALLDELNKFKIYDTVFIYQHRSNREWKVDGFLPITIGRTNLFDIEGAKSLKEKISVIKDIRNLFGDISQLDFNNPDDMLLLCGAFICIAHDYEKVRKHLSMSLIYKMLEIGGRASWLYNQGEVCIF